MTDPPRPLPAFDHETAGYFEAAGRGHLAVRVCSRCGETLHLPRSWCWRCRAGDTEWVEVSGRARLYSWTTVCQSLHPAFETPYTVVLVELEDRPGVRLAGMLPGEPELEAGMAMQVEFEDLGDATLPQFVPVGDR